MVRPTVDTKLARDEAERTTSERPAGSARFHRWMTISFVLIIGLIMYVGVLSDSTGRLTIPAVGSIVYVAAVIAIASLLAWFDRSVDRRREVFRRHPGARTQDKGRR